MRCVNGNGEDSSCIRLFFIKVRRVVQVSYDSKQGDVCVCVCVFHLVDVDLVVNTKK